VTCQAQPALGCVFKLVEVKGEPRLKMSQELSKMTLPGRKEGYRLYNTDGQPVVDLLCLMDGVFPKDNTRILCKHPFLQQKRAYFTPSKVEKLHQLVFQHGKIVISLPSLEEIRTYTKSQIACLRPDHLRASNPTPYKVSVTEELSSFTDSIWAKEVPISDLA